MRKLQILGVALGLLVAGPALAAAPVIVFPLADARTKATTPIIVSGTRGATVTVTPDAGAPVAGSIDDSGHVRVMVTFTGTGAHSFTVVQTGAPEVASGTLVVPAPGDLYTVPPGATAAEISAALATYHYVALTAGQTYTLTQPIIVPSNVYFDLAGSTLRLANGSNCYMLRNANEAAGDEQIVIVNGILDGNGLWQARSLGSGSYLTGYAGMGVAFTKVNAAWLDGLTLKEVNSWGISHWRCGVFLASNIVCDSIRRADAAVAGRPYPGNGDGVTGTSRVVYVWNVSGFANDDMVAVGTGRSTMGVTTDTSPFYEIGIPDVDVDLADIRNVTASAKSGTNSWSGAALYVTGGTTIKHAVIDGLYGSFASFAYRLTDWFGDDALGSLRQVHVRNRTATGAMTGGRGWLTGGTPHEGDAAVEPLLAFDARPVGNKIRVTGWKTEIETASVSVSSGTVGPVGYPDPTTFTCDITPDLGASAVTITATRSGGQTANTTWQTFLIAPSVTYESLVAPIDAILNAGFTRVFSAFAPAGVTATAYVGPDGKVVTRFVNSTAAPVALGVVGAGNATAVPLLTDGMRTLDPQAPVAAVDDLLTVTIPANSTITLVARVAVSSVDQIGSSATVHGWTY